MWRQATTDLRRGKGSFYVQMCAGTCAVLVQHQVTEFVPLCRCAGMTIHQPNIIKRFGDRERDRLDKLFRHFGSDNVHEAEAARGRIDSLLQSFEKTWDNLIELLGAGTVIAIDADIAGDIAALGDADFDRRSCARHRIVDLLARHRMSWNDLADALCGITPAPWLDPSAVPDPERVNPLNLIIYLLEQYIDLRGRHEYIAVGLWVLHTHVYNQFMVTPRMALRSPTAGCGKTQLIDVLTKLTARPAKFDLITTAAIFRLIDESHPTLFIDEADNLGIALQPNGRLRAVFNSGHRSGGKVALMEGGHLRDFSTFAPLLLALPDAMHGLPRTLNSRCITLMMRRSDGRSQLRRFEPYRPDVALDAAYKQILLWRNDVELDPDPEMPEGIHNRLADNWRPLLSIADSLGFGDEAREVMAIFARNFQDADARILLLGDIRKVFDTKAVDRLPSITILEALYAFDDADWNEFRGIRGDQSPHKLKVGELAGMLRDFGIRPRSIWPLNRTAESKSSKGYSRAQFEEVWRVYCTEDGTTAQSSKVNDLHIVKSGTRAGTK